MRSKGKIVLWPIYFDSAVSWGEGRRVPKAIGVKAPKTEDLVRAAVAAGFKAELQLGAAYPRYPYVKTGYVLIEAKETKDKVIKMIAVKLPRGG